MKEEFDSLQIPFNLRGARTDESIQAMRVLWSEPSASFHGKHFHFHDVKSYPKPLQQNGIPIHIGGHSLAAARRAGRLGNGFFPTLTSPDKLRQWFAVARDEAKKAGRSPDAIEFSAMAATKPDSVKALRDIGVTRAIVAPPSSDPNKLRAGLEKIANDLANI
jgi:alkanesulfonate monooxygenase SsuD/methylene tetrahydromethanopterin reductase-like flavin-dependent oxidoreductase (luciferase family)